ncbi:MAG: hypothetical protein R3327_01895 [Nitrosopumilaceae archaeon]|nr:hypothetical protein [Nitrosopumilaceae archaeon]
MGVRKFTNGDIEIDFFHDDEILEYRYSSSDSEKSELTKELAETLASTLASDICVEMFFDEQENLIYIELEECDYEEDE